MSKNTYHAVVVGIVENNECRVKVAHIYVGSEKEAMRLAFGRFSKKYNYIRLAVTPIQPKYVYKDRNWTTLPD